MNSTQTAAEDYHIEPGQKWQVDLFRPEDAAGVTALFRSVYGANYPIRAYVEPEWLQQENAARRIISSVARTSNRDIVGHTALFQSAPCKKIYESGAGLVHKDYRGGHGILTKMVAHGIEVGHREFGVELVYGEPVCNHVFSQKACYNLEMITRALEVDLMPAAAYSREKSATGRVSTMLCFRTLASRPHTVYLPAVYEKQLSSLYATLDDRRDFQPAGSNPAPGAKTRLDSEVFSFAGVARIAVLETGGDLKDRLRHEEQRCQNEGVRVFQIWLNLNSPAVGAAVAVLREMGYFFGGLLPRWFDSDGLLMQKIIGKPNWETIQTHYDHDRKLLEMVQADWKSPEI